MKLKCVAPDAIQDWELEAYGDGEAGTHVAEHLARCPACRARLAELVCFEQHLHQTLYRFDCPSANRLRDYYWGFLPANECQQVEAHLDACPHCRAELADLAGFVASERAQPSSTLLTRARQAAAQMHLVVAQLISPGWSPVPALRGEIRDVLLFDAEGIALSVNLEQEVTGTYTLFGQVLSPAPIAAGSYARLTVREKETAAVPVRAALDTNGAFALPDLQPAVYQLVIHLPEQRIVVPTLALKADL